MKSFLTTPVIWFIIGFVLFLLEFAIPGFILFFFGLGAWIVAILTLFLDISLNIQILIFIGTSLLTVLLMRNWLKRKLGRNNAFEQNMDNDIVGRTAIAETMILPGQQGRVAFKGTTWSATSTDNILPGEEVSIIGHESILLIVKSLKSI